MKKFIVTGKPLTLKSGTLQLTKEQAACRSYCLKALNPKEGLYLVTGDACFKVGETIGYDGPDIKRMMVAGLMEMDAKTKADEEKKARAELDAKIKAEARGRKTEKSAAFSK